MNNQDWKRRVGNPDQAASVRRMRFTEGRADGVKTMEVDTGGGLQYTVLESRGMDIHRLSYKGVNMSFQGRAGVVHPSYFDTQMMEFERNFHAGMLYTCGLRNLGGPDKDGQGVQPQHGRIAYQPATEASAAIDWDNGSIRLQGTMKEVALYGEYIEMKRTLTSCVGGNYVLVEDEITNRNYRPDGVMLLYHINSGYPFLSEKTQIHIPHTTVSSRGEVDEPFLKDWNRFSPPQDDGTENVYFHDITPPDGKSGYAQVRNEELGLALTIEYDITKLPCLVQWKSQGSGDYALGVEPAMGLVHGRTAAEESGKIHILQPGESVKTWVKITASSL